MRCEADQVRVRSGARQILIFSRSGSSERGRHLQKNCLFFRVLGVPSEAETFRKIVFFFSRSGSSERVRTSLSCRVLYRACIGIFGTCVGIFRTYLNGLYPYLSSLYPYVSSLCPYLSSLYPYLTSASTSISTTTIITALYYCNWH